MTFVLSSEPEEDKAAATQKAASGARPHGAVAEHPVHEAAVGLGDLDDILRPHRPHLRLRVVVDRVVRGRVRRPTASQVDEAAARVVEQEGLGDGSGELRLGEVDQRVLVVQHEGRVVGRLGARRLDAAREAADPPLVAAARVRRAAVALASVAGHRHEREARHVLGRGVGRRVELCVRVPAVISRVRVTPTVGGGGAGAGGAGG